MAQFSRNNIQALEVNVTKALRAVAADNARSTGSNKTRKVKAFKLGDDRNTKKFDLNDLSK